MDAAAMFETDSRRRSLFVGIAVVAAVGAGAFALAQMSSRRHAAYGIGAQILGPAGTGVSDLAAGQKVIFDDRAPMAQRVSAYRAIERAGASSGGAATEDERILADLRRQIEKKALARASRDPSLAKVIRAAGR